MLSKASIFLVLATGTSTLGQYLGNTDYYPPDPGYGGRSLWPTAKFSTSQTCEKDYSTDFTLHHKDNGHCFKMVTRTSLSVGKDPQTKKDGKDVPKIQGCIYLYKSDNCSENKDGDNKGAVDAMELRFEDRDKEVCLAFATHDDEKKYNSYMIEIVDPEKTPELYCEGGYNPVKNQNE